MCLCKWFYCKHGRMYVCMSVRLYFWMSEIAIIPTSYIEWAGFHLFKSWYIEPSKKKGTGKLFPLTWPYIILIFNNGIELSGENQGNELNARLYGCYAAIKIHCDSCDLFICKCVAGRQNYFYRSVHPVLFKNHHKYEGKSVSTPEILRDKQMDILM